MVASGAPASCLAPFLSPAVGLLAAMATVLLGGTRASSLLFRRLLWDVVRSPIGFFERTPIGTLLNHFSKETDTVDVDIPDRLRSLLIYAFGLLEVGLVVTVATPLAAVAILPLLLLYAAFQVGGGYGDSGVLLGSLSQPPCLWAGVSGGGSAQQGIWEPPRAEFPEVEILQPNTGTHLCLSNVHIDVLHFSRCLQSASSSPGIQKPRRHGRVAKTASCMRLDSFNRQSQRPS